MQTEIIRRTSLPLLDDSDEEALDLFDRLNPHPASGEAEPSEEEGSRPLGRLTKLKKDSKREKKKLKRKQKKARKLLKKVRQMEGTSIDIVTPLKLRKAKKSHGSGSEALSHDAGSSEFSSDSDDRQDIENQLLNLNPDAEGEEQGSSPRKRLKKSGRKQRIEEKEGFRVEQLGNQGQTTKKFKRDYEDNQEYSFDDIPMRGKKKPRKPKVAVPSNEQIMNNLKEQVGVVESDGQGGREGVGASYDNGLDTLYAMKDKRKGGIRINNKFFCDLEVDARDEEAQMPPPETLELQLKPKSSTHSSSRFTFLSKAETLKKQRGLESSVDAQEYQRRMQERAKQSIAKVVTSMVAQDFHDDIDLEVRVPTIARGKSADIINNTVFLKSFASKHDSVDSTPPPQLPLTKSCGPQSSNPQIQSKKEGLTRSEFYKQINNDQRMRKSKYISEEHLKESFKKTNLGELEEARKRNQEKRRKEALSEESEAPEEEPDSKENKMEQLLEQEERICGDRGDNEEQEGENAEEGEKGQAEDEKLEEVQFTVKIKEGAQGEDMKPMEEEKEINEQNQIIQELASASSHQEEEADGEEMEEGEEAEAEEEMEMEMEEEEEQQAGEQADEIEPEQSEALENHMPEPTHQQLQRQIELEEEGIMLRKRKPAESKPKHDIFIPQPSPIEEQPLPAPSQQRNDNKENSINLPNTCESPEKPIVRLTDEKPDEYRDFRKLRKFAMVIAQKRRLRDQGRQYAAEFIEHEAEEGSDNEEHDDMVKKIDYGAEEREYQGVDLDADLVELIDNAVDLNEEDEQEAFRKYLEDIRIRDREEIRKIIRGEFRTRQHEDDFDVDEDDRRRQERMEEVMKWMKQREQEDGRGIYLKDPEEEQKDSDYDSDSEYREHKRKKAEAKAAEEEAEADRIPEEEEQAMIQRFLENTLPAPRRESGPTKLFNLGALPESVTLGKSGMPTIGLSRLGSKKSDSQGLKVKKTSSLANQVFARNNILPKRPPFMVGKLGGKK